jgi:hypothetical protein
MKLYTFNFETEFSTTHIEVAAQNLFQIIDLINQHCANYEQTDDDTENYDTETLLQIVDSIHNFNYIETETTQFDTPQIVKTEYL